MAKWKIETPLNRDGGERMGFNKIDWRCWLETTEEEPGYLFPNSMLLQFSSNGSINTIEKAQAVVDRVLAGLNADDPAG